MRQWYAVKTKPRNELQATNVLTKRGIEVYLPQVPSRRPSRQHGMPLEPLFPGYLFCRLALETSDWVVARSAPGVAYVLGAAGVPTPLPDELVEGIRSRADAYRRHGWQPPFKHGDRIVIAGGPLAGIEAIFDRELSPRGRVRALLEVIGGLVPVDLDIGLVRRAG